MIYCSSLKLLGSPIPSQWMWLAQYRPSHIHCNRHRETKETERHTLQLRGLRTSSTSPVPLSNSFETVFLLLPEHTVLSACPPLFPGHNLSPVEQLYYAWSQPG